MQPDYKQWLENQKYDRATITAQLHRVGRVEKNYGDLDDHYAKDRLASVISDLKYSADDRRRGKPNPTKIPFEGDAYSNLASYRNAIVLYQRFRDEASLPKARAGGEESAADAVGPEPSQRFGLERDLQASLRKAIEQLEAGLTIVDEGIERSVDSGRIDITARDAAGRLVVIELKAGTAGRDAIGQILSYMGDVSAEEGSVEVRGVLVASDFDSRAVSAARMAPRLTLRRYSVAFRFQEC
ncbi:endonuclease NucS domain-containing protein [Methylocystis echinoides]|uniref:endonuclease NucS domain-containing protein n=1 Tax=Methylocystis echinoides TaxID=29468 RepID=UPI0034330823